MTFAFQNCWALLEAAYIRFKRRKKDIRQSIPQVGGLQHRYERRAA